MYGNIKALNEKPIKDASISFFDTNNKKIGSVYSSEDGFYAFFKVKIYSKVKIITKKTGYNTNISNFMSICSRMINYDIYLRKLPICKYALISGHLVDNNNSPLEGIAVYLLTKFLAMKKKYTKLLIQITMVNLFFQIYPRANMKYL